MLSRLWTLLLHVLVLLLHGHSNILDIVFHVNTCYTWHCHFIFLYHCYTDTITLNTIISWLCNTSTWTRCYIGMSLHRYSVHSYFISSLHGFTCIHVLIVPVFILRASLFLLQYLSLHEYSCIIVTWVFNTVHDCFLYS